MSAPLSPGEYVLWSGQPDTRVWLVASDWTSIAAAVFMSAVFVFLGARRLDCTNRYRQPALSLAFRRVGCAHHRGRLGSVGRTIGRSPSTQNQDDLCADHVASTSCLGNTHLRGGDGNSATGLVVARPSTCHGHLVIYREFGNAGWQVPPDPSGQARRVLRRRIRRSGSSCCAQWA